MAHLEPHKENHELTPKGGLIPNTEIQNRQSFQRPLFDLSFKHRNEISKKQHRLPLHIKLHQLIPKQC